MRLGLGTVQFGLDYGISNRSGCTPPDEVAAILSLARTAGITILDTAQAYGESESVLGQVGISGFEVITKTKALSGAEIGRESLSSVESAFQASLRKLKKSSVSGLLVHHGTDLLKEKGEELAKLLEGWTKTGLVKRWGVSVYSVSELEQIVERFDIGIVQLPSNFLDQRFIPVLSELRKRGIEVHARSLFLQGLLLMDPDSLSPFFNPIKSRLKMIRENLSKRNMTPLEGALAYFRDTTLLDHAIIGVNSVAHLKEILAAWKKIDGGPQLNWEDFALNEQKFVNPALWPKERT